jgi:hypothetical protein
MNAKAFVLYACILLAFAWPAPAQSGGAPASILVPPGASYLESLAAREVRRYVYLRTGQLLPIRKAERLPGGSAAAIVVARKDRPLVTSLAASQALKSALSSLVPEAYVMHSLDAEGRQVLLAGGDEVGTLYAAYRFAEKLGVRFYLDGDVIPDAPLPWARAAGEPAKGATKLLGAGSRAVPWPKLQEQGAPLFSLRGIQPFHDFPEGPDWWNRDDYLAIIGQLPKMRMNFLGLHTYPEGAPHAEPTVWIGLPGDFSEDGAVKFSYPSSYHNTIRAEVIPGNWGYQAKRTSQYAFGAADLFEHDAYGPEVMLKHLPQPKAPEACNDLFNRTGAMLREAFRQAHQLGVKTCVGTETPLVVPKALREALKTQNKSATNLAVIQELYEGIFQRAARTYDLDYYWLWTPEGWTWEATKEEQIRATTNDLFAAIAAHRKVRPPFKLATCGWVLGPGQDRALFDKSLPKDMAVSCINREVGKTPVDKAFAEVSGRGKWAIPWLEDDPALTSMQLWAGRMRRDALDARDYGCDGLLGIHWRTRVLGPAVSALAQAAWDQSGWQADLRARRPAPDERVGVVGGKAAAFGDHKIAGVEDGTIYQTVRYDVSAYRLRVPPGAYQVTLRFCEPHYKEAGKRVFDVKLQNKMVIAKLDIFAKVGQDRALDFTYPDVLAGDGRLNIEFVPRVEYPSIAGISVEGAGFAQHINCGGPAYKDYLADLTEATSWKDLYAPVGDFYLDWAQAQFGPQAALAASTVFATIDGHLPRPSDWIDGPGGIRPDARPWESVAKEYGWVDELASVRPQVHGAGNLDRFDYWLNTFRYMRAMAQVNCTWARYTNAFAKVKALTNAPAQKQLARETALPLRRELVRQVGEVYRYLLATVGNPGELGTVANWEQHLLPAVLTKPGKELAAVLGEDLPADAQPATAYHGPTRIIVPTLRTSGAPGENVNLKVIILSEQPVTQANLYWRTLGRGAYHSVPLKNVARGVYSGTLPAPAASTEDLEYYIKADVTNAAPVYFPATAPVLNQTVVFGPLMSGM